MASYEISVGSVEQIPLGEGRNVVAGGHTVAVFRTRSGAVFATQARCPHKGGPLADGLLGSSTLVCPLHERVFDLATGQEVGSDCRLKTYPARLDASGELLVRFD